MFTCSHVVRVLQQSRVAVLALQDLQKCSAAPTEVGVSIFVIKIQIFLLYKIL